VLDNPLETRGRHRVNNMNPEADLEADGWGNSMIEAYTDCLGRDSASSKCEATPQVPQGQNHIGHRAVRTRLKTNAAP
jgi:hypothetical protein